MPAKPERTYDVLGLLLRFRAFPHETEGKFCLVDCVVPPGLGAPPNRHAGETECFVVIDGTFDFLMGDATRRAGAGDVVVVPDGAVHAFTATGTGPGRLLIVNAPGHMPEAFFTGVGRPLPEETTEPPAPSGPPDIARVLAVAQATGMTILPPAA